MINNQLPKYRLLVVDDDPSALMLIEKFCEHFDYLEFCGFGSPGEALKWGKKNDFDMALIDFKMPEMTGIELSRELIEKHPESYFMIMTAHAEVGAAIDAIRIGVFDFLIKPFGLDEFTTSVEKIKKHLDLKYQNVILTKYLQSNSGGGDFIYRSQDAKAVLDKVDLFSGSDAPVLVTGETGVGKEIIARMIHNKSDRNKSPFVAVNCSAYAETLLESELFGHEKGAYTGADKQRIGRLEFAEKGTILLDEVCEIPLSIQVKLLRVLQEKEFERVGGNKPIKLNARIISATNRDLKEEIHSGRFREDLYYRLNTLSVNIGPIRERVEDIDILADYFLKRCCIAYKKNIEGFDEKVMEAFHGYPWPGNVRQLENAIDYAALCCDGDKIGFEHLPWEITEGDNIKPKDAIDSDKKEKATEKIPSLIQNMEIEKIRDSLAKNRWNKSKTALELGLTRRQLLYRLEKYNIV